MAETQDGKPYFSIIIPVRAFNNHLYESMEHCRELNYENYEIMVLPDEEPVEHREGIRVITTGNVGPAQKRDMASDIAKGNILAFIDDDAFPDKNWLANARPLFEDPEVAAVGGPGVTPESDSFLQKASGEVFSSILCSGKYVYRYVPKKMREVDDFPSCNFLIRKSIFKEAGGFSTQFWPGEDTKLCLDVTKRLGKKIIYSPDVLVYHHRRPLFAPHLRQVWNYALHRGYFAKRFPQTSLRLSYFIPSLFTLYLAGGAFVSLANKYVLYLFLSSLLVYLLVILISILRIRGKAMLFHVFLGIVMTHVTYGIGFIAGLISPRLREE
ncbi:glycosyltransferase [Candidatus Hakubella thermalkaliphila]|uniref:Glycosyltransferase 2-like domain-containing protein n=1 Tax=Candidatus Hakubella thermalkaliphila TaxID=2754717 RepID=A0A6V8P6G5_9ACTN|nr:glycosyltransferase [Candidatus Hakubella thermalkaliphila]GFP27224.1 hypothetical protein HKBW3S33_00638 [Candidatus Hakubella thermalkaliphila]GFP41195.1 hypothetical protein HKBW3C_00321 [Candidatus Hakubella thermalkaliphila]